MRSLLTVCACKCESLRRLSKRKYDAIENYVSFSTYIHLFSRRLFVNICIFVYVYIYVHIYMYIYTYIWGLFWHPWRDVGGWGRDPRKQKDFRTTVKKRPKQKISLASDVGVCYSITGTRVPYYISLSTFWTSHGNGNLFGTNRTKKWVRNWQREGRVSTVWISTPAPHISPWPACVLANVNQYRRRLKRKYDVTQFFFYSDTGWLRWVGSLKI